MAEPPSDLYVHFDKGVCSSRVPFGISYVTSTQYPQLLRVGDWFGHPPIVVIVVASVSEHVDAPTCVRVDLCTHHMYIMLLSSGCSEINFSSEIFMSPLVIARFHILTVYYSCSRHSGQGGRESQPSVKPGYRKEVPASIIANGRISGESRGSTLCEVIEVSSVIRLTRDVTSRPRVLTPPFAIHLKRQELHSPSVAAP